MGKNLLLDTSTLFANPHIIDKLSENNLYICNATIQSLYDEKDAGGEIGANARECCKFLDKLTGDVNVTSGIALEKGGTLNIVPNEMSQSYLPSGFALNTELNVLLNTCAGLTKKELLDPPMAFVTNDIPSKVQAKACGINVHTTDEKVATANIDTKIREIETTRIYIEKFNRATSIAATFIDEPLSENEFIVLKSEERSALTVHRNGMLTLLPEEPEVTLINNIKPLNDKQKCALWALTNPEIQLVILQGPAETAKTFLSFAAGLSLVNLGSATQTRHDYAHLLVCSANAKALSQTSKGNRGNANEEKEQLAAKYKDMLECIIRNEGNKETNAQVNVQIEDWLTNNIIEFNTLESLRGALIHDSFIVCDNVQNANPALIKNILSHMGSGSKIVLVGDPNRCWVSTLNSQNNGLSYCAEKMKESPLAATVVFGKEDAIITPLAKDAMLRMK